jgi:hypothetical protein
VDEVSTFSENDTNDAAFELWGVDESLYQPHTDEEDVLQGTLEEDQGFGERSNFQEDQEKKKRKESDLPGYNLRHRISMRQLIKKRNECQQLGKPLSCHEYNKLTHVKNCEMIEQETILMQMEELEDIFEKQNRSRTNVAHLTEEEIDRWELAMEEVGKRTKIRDLLRTVHENQTISEDERDFLYAEENLQCRLEEYMQIASTRDNNILDKVLQKEDLNIKEKQRYDEILKEREISLDNDVLDKLRWGVKLSETEEARYKEYQRKQQRAYHDNEILEKVRWGMSLSEERKSRYESIR